MSKYLVSRISDRNREIAFSTQYLTGKCLVIEVVKLETMDLLCICIIYMEVDPDRPLHL